MTEKPEKPVPNAPDQAVEALGALRAERAMHRLVSLMMLRAAVDEYPAVYRMGVKAMATELVGLSDSDANDMILTAVVVMTNAWSAAQPVEALNVAARRATELLNLEERHG